MRVIVFIEQAEVIREIREQRGIGGIRRKQVPRINAPPVRYVAEDVEGYFPTPDGDLIDPIGPVDRYF